MYTFTNMQMYKYANVQTWKCTNMEMYKYANVQVTNVQVCKCTNIRNQA